MLELISWLATIKKKELHQSVIYIKIKNPSVNTEECMVTNEKENWMASIKQFLENGECGTMNAKHKRKKQ